MEIKVWNIEALTGYKPFTTFYEDFSVSEIFGEKAVDDTFSRCFEEWKGDFKYFTEFTMVLNWKIWEHYKSNENLAKKYNAMWAKADEYALNNFKGPALRYYYQTTD